MLFDEDGEFDDQLEGDNHLDQECEGDLVDEHDDGLGDEGDLEG